MHVRIATVSLVLLPLALGACTGVEDREGGMFSPFPDGVTGAAEEDGSSSGGGMALPPASDFVPEEPTAAPLVVDTGDPPAVVAAGDDDDSAGQGADGVAAEDPTPAPPPAVAVVADPAVAVVEAPAAVAEVPVFAEVAPQPAVQVPVQVVPAAPQVVATGTVPGTCEAALPMSAPLSAIALIATIPGAEPARAIVRFPSGEERVVQVGDLLGDSGAKVLMITAGSIKLAEITVSEPDRAAIVTHYLHQSR